MIVRPISTVLAVLCVAGLTVLARDELGVIPGPVETFALERSPASASGLEDFYTVVLSTSEAALLRSEGSGNPYAVALSISGLAVVLGLSFAVGALVGRSWAPLLLLVPLLAALSQIDGRDFLGSRATQSVTAAAGLLLALYAAQVLVVLAGIASRRVSPGTPHDPGLPVE